MTWFARLGSWPLRITWVLVALLSGPTAADALSDASTPVAIVIAVVAWALWAVVIVALLVPRTVSLTLVRGIVPLAPVAAVGAVAAGADPSPLDAAVLFVASVAATWAFAPFVTDEFVDGSSYGPERRFALRTPVPVAAVAIVTWSIATALAGTSIVLAVSGSPALSAVVALVAMGAAFGVARSLHQLSRRWLVLVPTGMVLHDPLALGEAQLLPRRSMRSLGPATTDPPADATTVDLSIGAPGLVLALELDETVDLLVRRGRTAAGAGADRILFTPIRPAALLAAARDHRLPVATAS